MRREYQIVSRDGSAALRQFLAKQGTALVLMMKVLEAGKIAVEELVGEMGKAALEAAKWRKWRCRSMRRCRMTRAWASGVSMTLTCW